MTILVITCVRNEGPYLIEWLAHMRGLGVDRFLVFSNDCEDGTDAMLDAFEAQGWLRQIRHERQGERTIQWQALKAAPRNPEYKNADWVLFADVDEFPVLGPPMNTLQELVGKIGGDAAAIAMPWRLFGSSGLVEYQDAPVTERFRHAATTEIAFPAAHFIKTLYRRADFAEPGVHRPKASKGDAPGWAGPDGKPLPVPFAARNGRINLFGMGFDEPLVQLNHYSVRSGEEFIVKRHRGLPNRAEREIGLAYWVTRNFNSVEDDAIDRHAGATAAMRDKIVTPEIAELHDKAVAWHRTRFAGAMKSPETVHLLWQMQLAGSSAEPHPSRTRQHLARLAEAQNG